MTIQEKIAQLRSIVNQQLLPLIDNDFVLLDYPCHENIGDTLIWDGEIHFLRQTKHKCLFQSSFQTFFGQSISRKTIVCIHGGGNFGDLWGKIHSFQKKIIDFFPNNKVIILPQTVWYESQENIKADEVFFSMHPNVTMCARDNVSFKFMQEHFPKNKVLLVPDMAFFIDFDKFEKINTAKTERTLYAKRVDKELKNDSWPSFIPPNTEVHDWPTFERNVPKYAFADHIVGWFNFWANKKGVKPVNHLIDLIRTHFYRPQYIKDCVKFINPYDTIYSTRLHIAIASAMMGKKVYLMDNSYGKNFSFYDTWLANTENIQKIDE